MKLLLVVAAALGTAALGTGCGGSDSKQQGGAPPPGGGVITDNADHRCLGRAGAHRERKSGEPARISVKHVLVKYTGAKNGTPGIKRTREEACRRALDAYDALKAGTEWDALVAKFSDEAGAATRAGSLGEVAREDLDPAFADAAFELGVQEVSDIVESKFGFHVILRSQ